MDKIKKLLAKMSKQDLARIREATRMLQAGEISGIKLKGQNVYRYRVGNYRILYVIHGGTNVIIEIKRRNESTYS